MQTLRMLVRRTSVWLLLVGVAASAVALAASAGTAPALKTLGMSAPAVRTASAHAAQAVRPVPVRAAQAPVAAKTPAPAVVSGAPYANLTSTYCVSCHSDRLKTGGLSLQGLDLADVPAHAQIWEKVMRKMRTGEMPPPTVTKRPDAQTEAGFATFLESTIDAASTASPNPGRTPVHRLNRAEYSNAVRDLLAVDVRPGEWLPVDDSGYGFDNIAAVLSTSPALLDRYMSAAGKVARLAVGDLTVKAVDEIYDSKRDPVKGARNEQLNADLPFDSRAGMTVNHYFPVDAEYVFKLRLNGVAAGTDEAAVDPYQLRIPVKAGLQTVGITSPRENMKAESEGPGGGRGGGGGGGRGGAAAPQVPTPVDLRLNGARLKRFDVPGGNGDVSKLVIAGPYNPTGRGDTASRRKIFVCRPVNAAAEPACARTILTSLAHHAFRRPVTNADVQPLLVFYQKGRTAGDFDNGIQAAIQAMLVSPDFLFRFEADPKTVAGAPTQVHRVSDLELASRLSFFLWSTIPDDELLGVAERGTLSQPLVLDRQVRRMLDDQRSETLVSNFAGQWLNLRSVETQRPDPVIFPFDEALRQAFMTETSLFVSSIFREDRPLSDLLSADYTFVNARLAEHYGIPRVYGSQFRRVTLTDANRHGILGQGSVLTVTSYPNRTSVVQRGKWILETLLGTPPPPPPPDVNLDLKAAPNGKVLTAREQMAAHRNNPVCAGCHGRMDPLGFALENFDGVGRWRAEDAGTTIDVSGKLPDGTAFSGPAGLSQLLLTKYQDDFVRTATEKLLTYALGRGVEYYDNPAIRSIDREAARDHYRISSLILAIVKSTPFQMRRASES